MCRSSKNICQVVELAILLLYTQIYVCMCRRNSVCTVHWLHLLFAFCKHMQISHTVRVHCTVYTHHNFNQRTRLLLLKRRKKISCCTVIIKRDRRHDVYTKRTEREQTILIEINASPVDTNNLIEYNVRVEFFVGLFAFVFFRLFLFLFFCITFRSHRLTLFSLSLVDKNF